MTYRIRAIVVVLLCFCALWALMHYHRQEVRLPPDGSNVPFQKTSRSTSKCSMQTPTTKAPPTKPPKIFLDSLTPKLLEIYHLVLGARKHTRSGLAAKKLADAESMLIRILQMEQPPSTVSAEPKHAENKVSKCSAVEQSKECVNEYLAKQLTVIFVQPQEKSIQQIKEGFIKLYPNVTLHMILPKSFGPLANDTTACNDEACSNALFSLAKNTTTPYSVIIPYASYFDHNVDLLSMMQSFSRLGKSAAAVGGAYRMWDGHWFDGCHQMMLKNFTLTFESGYDRSLKSCIYCDYIRGPFVIRTENARKLLNKQLQFDVAVLDMFLKFHNLGHTSAICPEVMFHTDPRELSHIEKKSYLPLARYQLLNRIRFANHQAMNFSCDEVRLRGHYFYFFLRNAGVALPICQLDDHATFIKNIMDTFDEFGVRYQVVYGTTLGGVKFGGVLPWERDADFEFDAFNYTVMKKLIPHFKEKYGYILIEDGKYNMTEKCDYHYPCASFDINTTNWRAGIIGRYHLRTYNSGPNGNPTRVNIDGYWAAADYNPVKHLRKSYGSDFYTHCEHGWMRSSAGRPRNCPKGGEFVDVCKRDMKPELMTTEPHYCLRQYATTGSLQFRYP